jgi:hypothetical protein
LGATSVAFADFNRDGKMDAAVGVGCSGIGRIMIYAGYGDGTFNTSPTIIGSPSGSYIDTLVTADINNDGIQDIAALSRAGNLVLYTGAGDGTTFTNTRNLNVGTGTNMLALEVADLDNDGFVDYVITTQNNANVAMIMGAAAGSTGTTTTLGGIAALSFLNTGAARLMDWDMDGKLDIMLTKQYAGVQMLKGGGDGTFTTPTNQYSLPNPSAVGSWQFIPIDANYDGLMDILTINGDTNTTTSIGVSTNKSY